MEYGYEHFRRQLLIEDLDFGDAPRPGEPMPDFALTTTDRGPVSRADYVGIRPLLLILGSFT